LKNNFYIILDIKLLPFFYDYNYWKSAFFSPPLPRSLLQEEEYHSELFCIKIYITSSSESYRIVKNKYYFFVNITAINSAVTPFANKEESIAIPAIKFMIISCTLTGN